jgi:hypothetical protein
MRMSGLAGLELNATCHLQVTRAITQQQTITCMEEDLNRQLEKRNHLSEELERVVGGAATG